jgi:hypothetical protein
MALALRESADDNKAAIPFETKHFESLPVLPVCWMGVTCVFLLYALDSFDSTRFAFVSLLAMSGIEVDLPHHLDAKPHMALLQWRRQSSV